MITRTFSKLLWASLGPSDWQLVGYPDIKASFDGFAWKLHGREGFIEDVTFPSLEVLSKVVEMVCENISKNPLPKRY